MLCYVHHLYNLCVIVFISKDPVSTTFLSCLKKCEFWWAGNKDHASEISGYSHLKTAFKICSFSDPILLILHIQA